MTARTPSARERLRPVARSIFGLLAGFCVIVLVWFAAYVALLFVAPTSFNSRGDPAAGWGVVALVAVTAAACWAGGSIGTRLAQRSPLVHAALLAAMEAATQISWVGEFGAAAPPWFPGALVGSSVAAILLAGWRESRRVRAAG